MTLTREEFEIDYCRRNGLTPSWLHTLGKAAVRCDCGQEWCDGWTVEYVGPTQSDALDGDGDPLTRASVFGTLPFQEGLDG